VTEPGTASPANPASAASLVPLDRLLALVPGKVIAFYAALIAVVGATLDSSVVSVAMPVALVACTALVILGVRTAGAAQRPPVAPHPIQYVAAVLAFWAWTLTIRNPLDGWCAIPPWVPPFAAILIPAFGAYLLRDDAPTFASDHAALIAALARAHAPDADTHARTHARDLLLALVCDLDATLYAERGAP
jgi:hypothetical protein